MADKIERLAVEIRVEVNNEPYRGSGFLIGPGLIMTAQHVLDEASKIWIHLLGAAADFHSTKENIKKFDGVSFIEADKICCDIPGNLDIALLSAPHHPALDYFSFAESSPRLDQRVCGLGFPRATTGNEVRSENLLGSIHRTPSPANQNRLKIRFDDAVKEAADWCGASGAPVVSLDQERVLGVYIITEKRLEGANTAWAVPSSEILKCAAIQDIIYGAGCSEKELHAVRDAHEGTYRGEIKKNLPYFTGAGPAGRAR